MARNETDSILCYTVKSNYYCQQITIQTFIENLVIM